MFQKNLKIISYFGTAVLIVAFLSYSALFKWNNTSFSSDALTVYIESDWDFEDLKKALGPNLKNQFLFAVAAQIKGYDKRVRSGKYTLTKGLSNNELINRLRLKSHPITITFNNQERLENLAGRLSQLLEADSLALLNEMTKASVLSENGFTEETALAMYLPNSYEFFWDVTPESFCKRMHKEYRSFWNSSRKQKAQQLGLSEVEVIILASIVHKETVRAEERPTVAGVYLNRLRKGMKLQADPTVIYALKKRYQNFDTIIKRVLYKDLRIRSPYNTYRVRQLPPGPISMPDISAIEAVLNPKKHSYLYFVANPNRPGYHMFASSLSQHNRNKRTYVQWLNRNKLYR